MPTIEKVLTVANKKGLHARPAALFVSLVEKYDVTATLSKDEEKVNGKSIMGILMLGAEKGSSIIIEADGDDAEGALAALEKIISNEEEI